MAITYGTPVALKTKDEPKKGITYGEPKPLIVSDYSAAEYGESVPIRQFREVNPQGERSIMVRRPDAEDLEELRQRYGEGSRLTAADRITSTAPGGGLLGLPSPESAIERRYPGAREKMDALEEAAWEGQEESGWGEVFGNTLRNTLPQFRRQIVGGMRGGDPVTIEDLQRNADMEIGQLGAGTGNIAQSIQNRNIAKEWGFEEGSEKVPPGANPVEAFAEWIQSEEGTAEVQAEAAKTPVAMVAQDIWDAETGKIHENAIQVRPQSTKYYAAGILDAGINMGPAMAATIVTKNPNVGAAIMGGQVYGDTYGSMLDRGYTTDQAMSAALFSAAAETLTERIPLGVLTSGKYTGLKRILAGASAEGIQEPLTEALQMGYDIGILDDEITMGEAMWRLIDAGVIGFGVGGGMGAGVEVLDQLATTPAAKDAVQEERDLEETQREIDETAARRDKVQVLRDESDVLRNAADGSIESEEEIDRLVGEGLVKRVDVPRETPIAQSFQILPKGRRRLKELERQAELGDLEEDLRDGGMDPLKAHVTAGAADTEVELPTRGGQDPAFKSLIAEETEAKDAVSEARETFQEYVDSVESPDLENPAIKAYDEARDRLNDVTKRINEYVTEPSGAGPSRDQVKAGNYRKGHATVQGLNISIENPQGSLRRGKAPDGKPWQSELTHHYGYIKGTVGKDKDHLDVFIGPQPESQRVFVVNQKVDPDKPLTEENFDEHKVMIGFETPDAARDGYLSNYEEGWRNLGSIVPVTMDSFKSWVKDGNTTTILETDTPLFHAAPEDSLGFYSGLSEAVRTIKQEKGSPQQMLAMIKKQPGVKKEELEWTGLPEYLAAKGKTVTKEEIEDFVENNGVQVEEVTLTDPGIREDQRHLPEMQYGPREALETLEGIDSEAYKQEVEELNTGLSFTVSVDPDAGNVSVETSDGEYLEIHTPINRQTPQHAFDAIEQHLIEEHEFDDPNQPDDDYYEDREEGEAKYLEYTLPGGTNYREVLLRLPPGKVMDQIAKDLGYGGWSASLTSEQEAEVIAAYEAQPVSAKTYSSGHFDESNILAHLRVKDREVDGKKVLFIEEIQSDWHQQGRRRGYAAPGSQKRYEESQAKVDELWPDALEALRVNEMFGFSSGGEVLQAFREVGVGRWQEQWEPNAPGDAVAIDNYLRASQEREENQPVSGTGAVPDAPFKGNAWAELSLKRALRMAAEGGYDEVAWTTGQDQADRYDLSKKVESITHSINGDGTINFSVVDIAGRDVVEKMNAPQSEVESILGKEVTDKIIAREGERKEARGRQFFKDRGRGQTVVFKPRPPEPFSVVESELQWIAVSNANNSKIGSVGKGAVDGKDDAREYLDRMLTNQNKDDEVGSWYIQWKNEAGEVTETGTYVSAEDARREMIQVNRDYVDNDAINDPMELSGIDLKIGGEGMKSFYDKTLVNMMGKTAKKIDSSARLHDIELKDAGGSAGDRPFRSRPIGVVYDRNMDTWRIELENGREYEAFGSKQAAEDTLTVLKAGYQPTTAHSINITDKMRDALLEKGVPLFAATKEKRPGISPESVQAVMEEAMDLYPNAPNVRIARDEYQLPSRQWRAIQNAGMDGKISGIFDPDTGTIYLIASNLKSRKEALEVFLHESVGHYGMRSILGAEYDTTMDEISKAYPSQVRDAAKRNGLDPKKMDQRRIAAEEFIAYTAQRVLAGQKVPARQLSLLQRVVEALRIALARLRGLQFTDVDVERLVRKARIFVATPNAKGTGMLRNRQPPVFHSGLWLALNESRVSSSATADQYAKEIKAQVNAGNISAEDAAPIFDWLRERGAAADPNAPKYPMAPRSEWYGEADYKQRGGRLVQMTSTQFLEEAAPLTMDAESRENIDDLKRHIQEGRTLDPLTLHEGTRVRDSDGRHRAMAARELGIPLVPVVTFRPIDRAKPSELVDKAELMDRVRELGNRQAFHVEEYDGRREAIETGDLFENFTIPEGSRNSRAWNYLVFKAQDKFIDLLNVQSAIEQQSGRKLDDDLDAYLAEELFHGRVKSRIDRFDKDYIKPLIDEIESSDYTWDEVEWYLYARHAPEANRRLYEINRSGAIKQRRDRAKQKAKDKLDGRLERISQARAKVRNKAEADHASSLRVAESEYRSQMRRTRDTQRARRRDIEGARQRKVERADAIKAKRINEAESKYRIVRDDYELTYRAEIEEADTQFREQERARVGEDPGLLALSGMSTPDAKAAIEVLTEKGNIADMKKIAALVDKMTARNREIMVNEGLEEQSTIDAWESAYDYYVPLKGFKDGPMNTTFFPKKGKGYDTGGKLQQKRLGRRSEAANILANVVAQHQSAVIMAEKAHVGRTMLKMVQDNPNPDLWTANEVETKKRLDPKTGLVVTAIDPTYKLKDNVLRVKVDGKDYHITFNENNESAMRIAGALKNLSAQEINMLLRGLLSLNRILSAVNTSFNPEFIVSNLARDLQTAMINLNATDANNMKMAILQDVFKAHRGIRRFLDLPSGRDKEKADYWRQMFEEYRDLGGQVGWLDNYKDVKDLEASLYREMHDRTSGMISFATLRKMGHYIESENQAIENAVRLSAFVHARNAGLSGRRAASLAKNLTVNFNRKGDIGTAMNALYLFYNASIQGMAIMWKAAKSAKVRKVMYGIVAFAAAIEIMNRMIAGDDDDGENRYEKIPSWVKERNMIVMLPDQYQPRDPESFEDYYITIPLPYGYNMLHVVGQKIGGVIDYTGIGNKKEWKPMEDATEIVSAALGSFNPIGTGPTPLQTFIPTVGTPLVQTSENVAWHGGPVMPPQDPWDPSPEPESQQYFRSARKHAVALAEFLNQLGGGSKARPADLEFLDISPETIELWEDFLTGGAGRFVSNMIEVGIMAKEGEIDIRKVPFARRFVGLTDERAVTNRFYANVEAISYAAQEIKVSGEQVQLASTKEERQDAMEDRKRVIEQYQADAAVEPTLKLIQQQLKTLNAQRKAIQNSRRDDEWKTEQTEKIQLKKTQLMNKFNKKYNEIVEKRREQQDQARINPTLTGKDKLAAANDFKSAGYPAMASLIKSLPNKPGADFIGKLNA